MATSPEEILQRGIAAARAGQNDVARQLIARAIQMQPNNEQAWLWLSSVAQDDEERIRILQQVLQINPQNEYALKGLQALGALPAAQPEPEPEPEPQMADPFADADADLAEMDSAAEDWYPSSEEDFRLEEQPHAEETYAEEQPYAEETSYAEETYSEPPAEEPYAAPPTAAPPARSPVRDAPPPPAPEGIPLVEPAILDYAQQSAAAIINEILSEDNRYDISFDEVEWVPTTKRFRARVVLNPLVVVGIIGGIVAIAAITFGAILFIRNNQPEEVAALPTNTPTTTLTPTNTATVTALPSATATLAPGEPTFTPEATIPVGVPQGNLEFGITPTFPYFATPHIDNPRMDDAIDLYYAKDYAGAVEAIPLARETGPDYPDTYFFEGMSYAYLGDFDRAEVVIKDGLLQNPDIAALHAGLSFVYLEQGRVEEARTEAIQSKTLDPALNMPYLILSRSYRDEGLYEDALAEVDAALQLDPYDVVVMVEQGEVYMAEGRPDSAAAVGNLAVYIDPTSEEAVLMLARARIALGQYGQAVKPLETYLGRVNPASPRGWALLGRARYLEGSREQALDAFSRALAISDDTHEILLLRGSLFLEVGLYDEAYADFTTAIEQEDSYEARLGRATAGVAIGEYDTALEDIELALQEKPNDQLSHLIQAVALVETQRYNEGLFQLNQLLAVGFEDPALQSTVHEYRARALYFLQLYSDARTAIDQAMALQETGTRHFYRALILEANNDAPGAILEYDWVLFWDKIYGYPFADIAAERLDNLNSGGEPQGAESLDLGAPPAPDSGDTSEEATATPEGDATPDADATPTPVATPSS